MSAREEKRTAFNEQMNAWVSRQGLWFQLRHAADGQSVISRIARIFMRFLILLAVLSLLFWVYLIKRVESDGFKEKMRAGIEAALKGNDCKIGTFRKERDVATLAFIKIEGTEESFFHELDIRGVRMSMSLTDGLFSPWDGQSLVIDELKTNIKAGSRDNATAATAFSSLFAPQGGFEFERFECKDTNISWGYSEHNLGFISGSYLVASRENDGWKLEFTGGTFGQNWLKHLVIKKLVVLCYPEGVSIQEAELNASDGSGAITFRASIGSGGKPSVKGTMQIDSMPTSALLPPSFAGWIEGEISGVGLISGSTNSQEGVVLDIDLKLEDGDITSVRDSLPLLSALTVVDLYNSYRKVSFNEGTFKMRTGGNLLKITEFDLKAGDLLYLKGDVQVRPPSHQEIAAELNVSDVNEVTSILEGSWQLSNDELKDTDTGTSLSRGGRKETNVDDKASSPEEAVKNVFRASILAEHAVKRFDGELRLGLKPDAFDAAPQLKAAYPVDSASNRIWIEVPLEGRLQTLTLKQAEQMYILGRNRN